MKYIKVNIDLLSYNLPNWSVNPVKDSDHWLLRYMYSCSALKRLIRNSKRIGFTYLNLIGRLKDIGSSEYSRLQNKENSKIENQFLGWHVNDFDTFGTSDRKVKNPEESFEKIWFKVKEIIEEQRDLEKVKWKNGNLLNKWMGQSSPRLSFKDQVYVRKNLSKLPVEIKEFLFGKINPDFSNNLTLNPLTDFFEFPKLPTGGRIAQTFPDTLLVTYYERLKENTNTNTFNTDSFMDFIERFIGKDILNKWTKHGTVYRFGKTDFKKWFPASLELKGVLTYIKQTYDINALNYPLMINYGNVKYFDMYSYISYLIKNLEYSEKNDPEKEVLIPKSSVLDKIIEINRGDL